MSRTRILEDYTSGPELVRCRGQVRLLGFLWKVKCNYPLASESGICWRCGTKGPKHPDTIFWGRMKSQTTLDWLSTKRDIPARNGNPIKFFTYTVDTEK